MKTPLVLLVTAIMLAGCSTNSAPLNSSPGSLQPDVLSQTQEEYIQSLKYEIDSNANLNQKAMDNLDIKQCQNHSDEELRVMCELQIIMTLSAQGDKSLCKMLPAGEEKQACLED